MPRLLVLACLAAMAALTTWTLEPLQIVASPEGRVDLEGTVERTRCRGDRCDLVLSAATVGEVTLPNLVRLRTDGDSRVVTAGDRLRVRAHLSGDRRPGNPGVPARWSPTRWRWRAKAVPGAAVHAVEHARSPLVRARTHLLRRLQLPDDDATTLYRALLLGDRSQLPGDTRFDFADAGAAHLLAISGLHLAIIGVGLYRLLVWLLLWWRPMAQTGRPQVLAGVLAGLFSAAYVATITPTQATLRAGLVLGVLFLGGCVSRLVHPGRTLAFAALVLVAADPAVVLGPSFQLSFAAAGALVLGFRHVRRALAWVDEPGNLPAPEWVRPARWFVLSASVCVTSWVATAPLALAWFGQLAPAGLVTNLVAVPLVALVVVPVGLLWLALALVAPSWAARVTDLPVGSAGLLLDLVDQCAELAGPSTAAAWPHAAGAAVTVAMLVALWRPRAGLPLLVAALAAVPLVTTPAPGLTLTALDVGHGDALLLDLPDGRRALVDTGGSRRPGAANGRIAAMRLLPALVRLGASELDLLVITHADRDHYGTALALADRVPIRELWLPPCHATRPELMALAGRVAATGGVVRQVHAGRPFDLGGAEAHPLWPAPSDGCHGTNDSSLVLALTYAGRRLLLTGDIEGRAERALLARHPAALRADVLKVGHHGSKTSTIEPFLDAVDPRVAVVSGAVDASPMPPHAVVLQRLRDHGAAVWVTGLDGAVRVHVHPSGDLEVGGWRRGW